MRRLANSNPLLVALGLLFLTPALSAAVEMTCAVKYVSAEHVYLDAGTTEGLTVGLHARVVRGKGTVAELEVVYAAAHSASCKVLASTGEVLVGDIVVYDAVEAAEPPPADIPETPAPSRTREVARRRSRPVGRPGPRASGYVALQWDHTDESMDRDLRTDLVSLPFRLRVDDLGWGTELRLRGSLRRILRSGYSSSTPAAEWRNRIQEVNLTRDDRRLDFHLAIGRITSRYTASAGPFDGIALDHRVAGDLRVGVFGGFAPEWSDLSLNSDVRVTGLVLNLNRRQAQSGYLDVVLAGVGRYEQGEISREYLNLTTSWRDGRRLSLLQAAEVDINRGWRKDSGRSGLELTSLALTGRYALRKNLNVNLGYDDREPVRTWENRSLPDSLFTDAGRVGWRSGLTWRGPGGRHLSLWGSLRDRQRDSQRTTSWQGRVYLPRLTAARLDATASLRGFDGPFLSGWSPTLSLARSLRTGGRVSAEGGHYEYTDANGNPARSNTWLSLTGYHDLSARLSASLEYRRDWGDDIAGNRWFLELRRRF